MSDVANPDSIGDRRGRDDALARELRGFGAIGILAILAIYFGNALFEPLSALLVLLWAWRSGTSWHAIGLRRPPSWLLAIVGGILFGVLLKLAMKALVMPLLGAPPTNAAFSYLIGNDAALPGAIFLMVVSAGFGEEIVYRGFFFERLGRLIGDSPAAMAAIVLLTSLIFGLGHIANQGWPGFIQALIVGLAFGTIYAITRRLWMLIAAHAAFDLTALAIIYFNEEAAVAGFVWG